MNGKIVGHHKKYSLTQRTPQVLLALYPGGNERALYVLNGLNLHISRALSPLASPEVPLWLGVG